MGNIRSIFDAIRDETAQYTYDHLNRLTTFATGATTTLPQITIRARGSNADGWPVMQLRGNGEIVQEWTVSSSAYANYTAQFPLTGSDKIDIVFTNDYCLPTGCANGDRNLYVDYFVVDGQTIQAESSAVSYDRGSGAAAFDGADVIAGQEAMGWSGALRTTVSKNYNWATAESFGYNAIGNMTNMNGATYSYNDAAHKHAVTAVTGGYTFGYDANGNMTSRTDVTGTYTQIFNVENRLTGVTKSGEGTTTFVYDANGQRVMTVKPDGTIIYSPFPNYEEEVRPAPATPTPTNTPIPTNTPPTNGYQHAPANGNKYFTPHGDALTTNSYLHRYANGRSGQRPCHHQPASPLHLPGRQRLGRQRHLRRGVTLSHRFCGETAVPSFTQFCGGSGRTLIRTVL